MHEMALAEGVRGIVEDAVDGRELNRVKAVILEIGELSSVEVEALSFCLEVVLRGTVAEGARIGIETVAGTGWCMNCRQSVPIARLYEACPNCGSYQVQATGGTEMRVRELEIE